MQEAYLMLYTRPYAMEEAKYSSLPACFVATKEGPDPGVVELALSCYVVGQLWLGQLGTRKLSKCAICIHRVKQLSNAQSSPRGYKDYAHHTSCRHELQVQLQH